MLSQIVVLFSFLVLANCELNVITGPNATLTTYLSNATVVSSEPKEIFEKRSVNASHPVSVFCRLEMKDSKDVTVLWLKNNKELTVADRGRDNQIIDVKTDKTNSNVTTTLTVKAPTEQHATSYVCKFSIGSTTLNGTVYILSAPIITSFSKAKRAIQGDKLKITCAVNGYPLPKSVTWYFGNRTHELPMREGLESSASENGVKNAIIRFSSLNFEDRGTYWCTASNSLGEDTAGVLVRAKNRLDALWPFLGIVAEVAILVTLILVYEKKRSTAKRPPEANGVAGERPKEDEDAVETAPENKEGEKDEDVRQRPAKV